jgi:hypothetical protein
VAASELGKAAVARPPQEKLRASDSSKRREYDVVPRARWIGNHRQVGVGLGISNGQQPCEQEERRGEARSGFS